MKPLETVEILFWLSLCRAQLEHFLNVAEMHRSSATPFGVTQCLQAASGMCRRINTARQNHFNLTWEGGVA